jgi:hypothetical protein
MTYGNTQYSNQNSFGKKIYENMHYNQKKQTYKTMECNLLDGGTIFVRVSEGQKGGNRNSAGIALDIREASELIKILEVAVEEAIRKKINE